MTTARTHWYTCSRFNRADDLLRSSTGKRHQPNQFRTWGHWISRSDNVPKQEAKIAKLVIRSVTKHCTVPNNRLSLSNLETPPRCSRPLWYWSVFNSAIEFMQVNVFFRLRLRHCSCFKSCPVINIIITSYVFMCHEASKVLLSSSTSSAAWQTRRVTKNTNMRGIRHLSISSIVQLENEVREGNEGVRYAMGW